MADLFSFLDNVPDEKDDVEMAVDLPEPTVKKRKVDEQNGNLGQEPHSVQNDEPAGKKARIEAANPVVLDEFETEAKREVAASAGLQGSVEEGARLELRHQVHLTSKQTRISTYFAVGSPPSRSAARLPLCTHNTTCSACKT